MLLRLLRRLSCALAGHQLLPGVTRARSITCWCCRCGAIFPGDLGVRR